MRMPHTKSAKWSKVGDVKVRRGIDKTGYPTFCAITGCATEIRINSNGNNGSRF